ncbi:uncharacterized protein J3R85_016242 [Psidium guajava]|nr:uncharacterized protein J3R85_016242 [Psidium guajava]
MRRCAKSTMEKQGTCITDSCHTYMERTKKLAEP